MNDIYDAFADAYQKEAMGSTFKQSKTLRSTEDLEAVPTINGKASKLKTKLSSSFSSLRTRVSDSETPFVLSVPKARPDYAKAFIGFAICGLFLLLALFNLPSLVLAPRIFTFLFTSAMVSLLAGIAFYNGPQQYLSRLSQRRNIAASVALTASIVLSLYFSVIQGSYLWSLVFCIVQVRFMDSRFS